MDGKIYIAFINGYFPPFWKNLAGDLHHCLPYPFERFVINIDLKIFYSLDRNQYHSTLLLAQLLKFLPEDGEKIVGITDVDIFIPILTFLFGEAQLGGKGALVSTYRLANDFYGLPADNKLLYQRAMKEVLHELGHTFGLIHCPDYECVMNSSTYVENIDLKKNHFCPVCQQKLNIECQDD